MILTLTLNPSLDRTIEISALARGAVIRAAAARLDPGGKGVNVSRALLANGVASRAVVPYGGDEGGQLVRLLGAEGLDMVTVPVSGATRSNVTLAVSTVRTARGGNAPDLKSLVVQYPQVPRPAASASDSAAAPSMDRLRQFRFGAGKSDEAVMERAAEQQAVADVSGFQVVFKIPGRVSLGASEGAKSLRISSTTIAPDLAVRAAPVLDPTAFVEASFKQTEDAPLLPGRVAIYRDGVFVGRGQMAAASKDETVRLGFGADDKIKIERTVLKRNEGSAGLIVTTSKTDERAFKTTVRNGHDFPIRIAIEDQLPVSENEEIQVEMLPSTTPPTASNIRDRRGVLEWAFEAKAGEVRDITFAWRIRWPKDKGVVIVPAG